MYIDIRTVMLLSLLLYIFCTLFIVQLWIQNRNRFRGTFFWVTDFVLQTAAFILIILRGNIPDWMSIVLSNFMVISGSIAGYIGLLKFVEIKSRQVHNYLMILIFTCFHIYFTFFHPSLDFRNINISAALFFVFFQCSRLLLMRVNKSIRPLTLWTGIVFVCYSSVSIIRIALLLFTEHTENDFYHSGAAQAMIIIIYQILFILLIYSLIMMVNKRLLMDISIEEEKFSKAFHSAPYAITLSRMSDGTVIDINKGFISITGYNRDEVIGKTTLDLHMFLKSGDRDNVINALTENGKVTGMDLQFIKKNGDLLTGHLSADMIIINGEKYILSSIADITGRKLAENKIKTLLAEKELILKEVHHRLKNNMNTINSLLNLQAAAMTEPAAVSALEDAGNRVQSMMVLYDKLYQAENFNEVPVAKYLPALINQIVSNFPNSNKVNTSADIEDFNLDPKIVSSLGIIINELLTNIMKHAFTGRTIGSIHVSASLQEKTVKVTVKDDGNGIPESVDLNNSCGFGFELVKILTEQIGGIIRIERGIGTKFIIEFGV